MVHCFIGPLVHWSIGPLVHLSTGPWSIGPLVHCSIGLLVHWSIGWMSNVKCQYWLNFCRSVPPEFLRSFLYLTQLYGSWYWNFVYSMWYVLTQTYILDYLKLFLRVDFHIIWVISESHMFWAQYILNRGFRPKRSAWERVRDTINA